MIFARLAALVAGLVLAPAVVPGAWAQTYPTKPVTLVVPFPRVDRLAVRMLGGKLEPGQAAVHRREPGRRRQRDREPPWPRPSPTAIRS